MAKVDYLRPRVGNPCSPDPLIARIGGFTIIELLIVMAIIIVLAGLIIGTSGYVQKKGARSRAEAEIAALSAALESYKADNGVYPQDSRTDALDARKPGDIAEYQKSSLALFEQLSGLDANGAARPGARSYFSFKPQMLGGNKAANGSINPVLYIKDPFGNAYGYSTANQTDPKKGYNPTFDLWSPGPTEDIGPSKDQVQWIKNW